MSNFLGLRIAEARQKAGLSQAELGDKSGIAQTQISRYESGRAAPRRESIEKLAKALDVPLDWLLSAALVDETGADRGEFVFQPSPENLEKLKALSTLTGKSPDELVQQMFEELEARLQNSFKTTIHATMAPPVAHLKGGPPVEPKDVGQALEHIEQEVQNLRKVITAQIELTMPRPRAYWETEGDGQEPAAPPPDPDKPAEK
ncbi:helix-turn-helix domain-containing protein [Delftia acidovorans]|uniref:helix-turn-helix domain-containing protein n=1 Tax=Delftia acidovorans TaxID=80866 RepID=UPI00286F1A55|nr:helix-turn-helix transcriptional regulator [Delftia acidovorans]